MSMQMPVPIPTRSAFAAYAAQQSFSSGSSAQSSGQAGQFGLPRRRRPLDPEASSPQHACSNVRHTHCCIAAHLTKLHPMIPETGFLYYHACLLPDWTPW